MVLLDYLDYFLKKETMYYSQCTTDKLFFISADTDKIPIW